MFAMTKDVNFACNYLLCCDKLRFTFELVCYMNNWFLETPQMDVFRNSFVELFVRAQSLCERVEEYGLTD